MRNWIVVAMVMTSSISACNTQNALQENSQWPRRMKITMADVVAVSKPKTTKERQQQERFIKTNIKRYKSRSTAGAYYVAQAKRTFNEEKTDSSKYLFSRAWLLDSTNTDILWGYGLIYGKQKQYDKALFVLYKALEQDKQNPRLLVDIATSHLGRFYLESNPKDLLQSKKLLEKAVKLSPDQADAYYKLAISNYYLRDYSKAWDYLHKSVKRDETAADKTFIAALLQKKQDPQGVYDRRNIR
jgi:tetratricopeptide (TPR) repeat protein